MVNQPPQLIFLLVLLKREEVLAIDIDPQGNTTSGLGVDKIMLRIHYMNYFLAKQKQKILLLKM